MKTILFAVSTQLWHLNADVSMSIRHSPLPLYLPLQNEFVRNNIQLSWKLFLWTSWAFLAWATFDIKNFLKEISAHEHSASLRFKDLLAFGVVISFFFSTTWSSLLIANYSANLDNAKMLSTSEKYGVVYHCNSKNRGLPQATNFRATQPNTLQLHPTSTDPSPKNTKLFGSVNSPYIFNKSEAISFRQNPEAIDKEHLIGIRIGNHFNSSKGYLEICSVSEHEKIKKNESELNSPFSQKCSQLALDDSLDNEFNLVHLEKHSAADLIQIRYYPDLVRKVNPPPVLWVGNLKDYGIKMLFSLETKKSRMPIFIPAIIISKPTTLISRYLQFLSHLWYYST